MTSDDFLYGLLDLLHKPGVGGSGNGKREKEMEMGLKRHNWIWTEFGWDMVHGNK